MNIYAYIQALNDYFRFPAGLLLMIAYQENGRTWNWNTNAVSPTGAKGVMQLRDIALKEIQRISGFLPNPFNIIHALYGSGIYLKWLYSYFGNWRVAIAAYNYGFGNVRNLIKRYGYFNESALPSETRNYLYVADYLGL